MTDKRQLHRHRPYFAGWAQAFGHHEMRDEADEGRRWLFGEGQVGLILGPSLRTRLCGSDEPTLGGILADKPEPPAAEVTSFRVIERSTSGRSRGHGSPAAVVDLGSETVRLGRLRLRQCPHKAIDALRELFDSPSELHFFETYHLIYPTGTRILTLSERAPLGLIYRQLAPAMMRSAPRAQPTLPALRSLACA